MPRNIVMASTAIETSVAEAFFDSGGRNAGTPFETASTPVIAVQPLANAVSSRNIVSRVEPALAGGGRSSGTIAPRRVAVEAARDQHEDADDEEVRGDGEDAARLPDAAKVAEHQNSQKRRGTSPRGTPSSARQRRRDGEHAGRDADRDGQRVVDEERRRGDEAGALPDVLLGDDVRAAARRIGVDRLAVGKRDDGEQRSR